MSVIARGTPGFSGAELANLINEAALLAARTRPEGRHACDELEEARDKVRWGRERRSLAMTDKEKENTAWHEAGHALVNVLLEHTDPLHKVTIIPRGPSLGVDDVSARRQDKYSACARRNCSTTSSSPWAAASPRKSSPTTSPTAPPATSSQATRIARTMVCEWGMSEKLGMVEYGDDDELRLPRPRHAAARANYSEATAQEIDAK